MKISALAALGLFAGLPVADVASAQGDATHTESYSEHSDNQPASSVVARPPKPLAFEGGHALRVAAVRQRLLSQVLEYTLTVDADGKVTDCELTFEFRRRATEYAICRPFEKHMTFEPAIDETGAPTVGKYTFELSFNMFMTREGYLEERFR